MLNVSWEASWEGATSLIHTVDDAFHKLLRVQAVTDKDATVNVHGTQFITGAAL